MDSRVVQVAEGERMKVWFWFTALLALGYVWMHWLIQHRRERRQWRTFRGM